MTKNNILDQVIGVEEAAELWNLSPGYIKNLCAEGKVQAKKIGKTWIIARDQENPSQEKSARVKRKPAASKSKRLLDEKKAERLEHFKRLAQVQDDQPFGYSELEAMFFAKFKKGHDKRSRRGSKSKQEELERLAQEIAFQEEREKMND